MLSLPQLLKKTNPQRNHIFMNTISVFTTVFILFGGMALSLTACRSSEVPVSDDRARGSNGSNELPLNPVPFSWDDISNRYEKITSYTSLYEKEEKDISKGEKQVIRLSFRKPFDIRMDWLGDNNKVSQSAVYQEGKNDGKVLGKANSFLGSLAGVIKVNPTDPIALQDSKHPITEAGLGNLIKQINSDAKRDDTKVVFHGSEKTDEGRGAYKIEIDGSNGHNLTGSSGARKALVWIDTELLLPIRVEVYGNGEVLLERHVFRELKTNIKLTDKAFEL